MTNQNAVHRLQRVHGERVILIRLEARGDRFEPLLRFVQKSVEDGIFGRSYRANAFFQVKEFLGYPVVTRYVLGRRGRERRCIGIG